MRGRQKSESIPLDSIFNLLNNNEGKLHYKPAFLDKEINYPVMDEVSYDHFFYKKVYDQITENLMGIDYTNEYLNSLLEVLESDISYVPSSTNVGEVADISLFDHVKITAAVASCIEQWLNSEGITDYQKELFINAENFYEKKVFMMFGMDFSGIQKFIYTTASKNAHKMLRSRSFYLELMMQHIIDELLESCNLSAANLLYSGGGHAYVLLPNTVEVEEKIEELCCHVNEWLLERFNISLYLGYGTSICSANELGNKREGDLARIYRTVSKEISRKKMNRYSVNQIVRLNKGIRER